MPVTSFAKQRVRRGWLSIGAALFYSGLATAEPAVRPVEARSNPSSHEDPSLEPHVKRYPVGDGVYGRFAGDLDLSPKLGASYDGHWSAAIGASAWYFWTAGLTFVQSESPSTKRGYAKGQSLIALEIRPLFIPRWSRDLERGPAWFNLVVDSLALGVGVYFNHGVEAAEKRGIQASLGLGVPLVADARGPWIDVLGIHRIAETPSSSDNAVLVALSWHWLINTGLHDE